MKNGKNQEELQLKSRHGEKVDEWIILANTLPGVLESRGRQWGQEGGFVLQRCVSYVKKWRKKVGSCYGILLYCM